MQTQFNIQHGLLAFCSLVALAYMACSSWSVSFGLRFSSGNDNYFLLVIPNNILSVILLHTGPFSNFCFTILFLIEADFSEYLRFCF